MGKYSNNFSKQLLYNIAFITNAIFYRDILGSKLTSLRPMKINQKKFEPILNYA